MFILYYVSCVTCHVLRVTCHVLPVTKIGLSCGAGWWRVCYQWGLLRLVMKESLRKLHSPPKCSGEEYAMGTRVVGGLGNQSITRTSQTRTLHVLRCPPSLAAISSSPLSPQTRHILLQHRGTPNGYSPSTLRFAVQCSYLQYSTVK